MSRNLIKVFVEYTNSDRDILYSSIGYVEIKHVVTVFVFEIIYILGHEILAMFCRIKVAKNTHGTCNINTNSVS